ncbi:MAG TPA: PaaX family transcriptional regulator C-terminal domain-containing protein [Enteractinococcus sp.]
MKPIPRHQRGIAPQSIIAVLFGDYWFGRPEPIPSAALVDMLDIFGISENGARAAIQRLAQRKFLVSHREGRRTAYAVHTSGKKNLAFLIQRLFQSHLPQDWDGTWTILTYGTSELPIGDARLIREELKELAFGRLNDSLWIKPGHHNNQIAKSLQNLPPDLAEGVTYFENATLSSSTPLSRLRQAFDAESFDLRCHEFTNFWNEQARAVLGASPSEDEALRLRTRVMSEWRALIRDNPKLPAEMMPSPAAIQTAAETCAQLYDTLGDLASLKVRTIIQEHDPSLANLVTYHTFKGAETLIHQVLEQ